MQIRVVSGNLNTPHRKLSVSEDSTRGDSCLSASEWSNLNVEEKLSVVYKNELDTCQDTIFTLVNKVGQCLQIHNKLESMETSLNEHGTRIKLLKYKSVFLEIVRSLFIIFFLFL